MALTTNSTAAKGAPNKATARSVPAFLNKLYSMVNDPDTNHLIRWSDDGDSFYVVSADRFGHDLLPKFFKHSNFGSFQRQLNMYGFHKVPHLHQGVLQSDSDESNELLEFSNNNFAREQPDLLCLIKRQKARTDGGSSTETALDLPSIITDLVAIRKHQTALSADIKGLQSSNSTLWQEAIQSRDKQAKLQETVTKILRFLATVFGGQVVGQEDESPRENVVEEEVEKEDQNASAKGKGKGKGKEQAGQPAAKRPRLLLEDVKGRERGETDATSELFDLDDEDIEEIQRPADDDDNAASNASKYASLPTLQRTTSSAGKFGYGSPSKPDNGNSSSASSSASSRFTTLPSSTATPVETPLPTSAPVAPETQYHLPPDYLASLLSGGNSPATLEALFQLQNGGGLPSASSGPSASTSAPTPDFSGLTANGTHTSGAGQPDYFYRALLPSPKPAAAQAPPSSSSGFPPSNPLEGLISPSTLATIFPSSADTTATAAFGQQLAAQTDELEDKLSEKADIDQRTSALESAIAKLMQALPAESMDRLSVSGPPLEPGGAPFAPLDGAPWDPNQTLSDADLEALMAQFTNTANNAPSTEWLDEDDEGNPFDPHSALGTNPMHLQQHGAFEQLSPSDSLARDSFSNSDGHSTRASTPDKDDEDWGGSSAGTGNKRGRKRKSAAMDAPSPAPSEGTRKSARQKR
ncbi:hypothetical protein RQP46_009072 [Phenoliferia psychrophenolica]